MESLCRTKIFSRELWQRSFNHFSVLMCTVDGGRTPFLQTAAGQDVEKKLYSGTRAEMHKYIRVLPELI